MLMAIGEFAQMTGLSIKALRHYDEKGVLVPAEVDPGTGYRRYSAAQVRAGALIHVLREAGVPLTSIASALHTQCPQDVLNDHRRQVLAKRAAEDKSFSNAEFFFTYLAAPVKTSERDCPAQPYIEYARTAEVDNLDSLESELTDQAMRLTMDLHNDGFGPIGPSWLTFCEGDHPEHPIVLWCIPTKKLVPPDWGSKEITAKLLPKRRELVVTCPSSDTDFPSTTMHPSLVVLFDALAERDIAITSRLEVRQIMDAEAIEFATTIKES